MGTIVTFIDKPSVRHIATQIGLAAAAKAIDIAGEAVKTRLAAGKQ